MDRTGVRAGRVGAQIGQRDLTSTDPDCAGLARAVALAIAVALHAEGALRDAVSDAASPAVSSAPRVTASASPSPSPSPSTSPGSEAPSTPVVSVAAARSPLGRSRARREHVSHADLGLIVAGALWLLPALAVGAGVRSRRGLGRTILSVRATATLWPEQRVGDGTNDLRTGGLTTSKRSDSISWRRWCAPVSFGFLRTCRDDGRSCHGQPGTALTRNMVYKSDRLQPSRPGSWHIKVPDRVLLRSGYDMPDSCGEIPIHRRRCGGRNSRVGDATARASNLSRRWPPVLIRATRVAKKIVSRPLTARATCRHEQGYLLRIAEPEIHAPFQALPLREVYRQHAAFVWRALRALGVREADLDDVMHEVFLVVHRKLSAFEGRAKYTTWLFAIAERVASDYRRSARIRREDLVEDTEASAAPRDSEFSTRRIAWRCCKRVRNSTRF